VQSDGQSETAAVTTTVDSPMRLRAATSPGTRIATGSKSTQVAEPTGIDAAEVDVVVERRFAEAGSPAGDQWPTESPGEERDQIAAVARPPSPVVETTRSLPTPQPRDWKELIADPRTLGGVAAAIGFLLIGMSAWHLLRPDSARDPSHHVQSLVTNSALIEPRPAHAASPKTTVLLPEDIATAASATPVTAVAAPPAASDASASSAALSAAGLAAPESAAGDSRSSQPLFFANDLRLGLADPFGPILDAAAKSSPPESTGSSPAGLDVTASLGSDLSPVTPAVVSSEPPR
jgi:hypothetical protein